MNWYTLTFLTFILSATVAVAFTSPTVAPPGGNITAPINVGTVNQVKNANLGVNGLAVFGNTILQGKTDFPGSGIWNSSGNVGIGTPNPLRRLEVNNAMKFTNTAPDGNDGVIGTRLFNEGLNIVGINTDTFGRKVSWWGSFIQHENLSGNFFVGNTNFPGSGIWNSNGKVGIGTRAPIGTLNVEDGAGTATICLNGVCTASLTGATGYTGSFDAQGSVRQESTNNAALVFGHFVITPTSRITVTNGLIVGTAPGGVGTAVASGPRCYQNSYYCAGDTPTAGLICTSAGYTLSSFSASFASGAYGWAQSGVMKLKDGSCTSLSGCLALVQVTCLVTN